MIIILELNQIHLGDCLDIMKNIDNDSIDLTVTSPPYDNLRNYNNSLEWSFDIFKPIADELFRVAKHGGVVVWVVGDATIKRSETGSSFKQALYFKDIGFDLHDTMIYQKASQPRQNNRYEQSFEYMFVFSKGKIKTTNLIRVPSKNAGKVVKRTCRDNNRDDLKNTTNVVSNTKIKDNIWFYGSKKNETGHPAIFPEQLAYDHIVSWSNERDLVLDPFAGSGTTCKMAMLAGRDYIGIEKDEEYYELAKNRISEASNTNRSATT